MRFAVGRDRVTFDDVQLGRMRRPVIVHEGLVVQANGVDHQRIAVIMTDRFAQPGWRWIGAVRHVHIDVPDIGAAFVHDRHFTGRLQEKCRFGCVGHDVRHAAGPAARLRGKCLLALLNIVIRFLHRGLGPGLQYRAARIAHSRLDCATLVIPAKRKSGVVFHRTRSAIRWRQEIETRSSPSHIAGREIRHAGRKRRNLGRGNQSGRDAGKQSECGKFCTAAENRLNHRIALDEGHSAVYRKRAPRQIMVVLPKQRPLLLRRENSITSSSRSSGR